MNSGQLIYGNRTLTLNLCSYEPGTPNHSFCHNQPQIFRTRPITASFSNFCSCFLLRTNQKKPNIIP